MKIYPLENNKDLLHTCYSALRLAQRGHTITHIVHSGGNRTLCGISLKNETLLHGYSNWAFDIWSAKDDKLGVENVGCIRCKKSRRLIEAIETLTAADR